MYQRTIYQLDLQNKLHYCSQDISPHIDLWRYRQQIKQLTQNTNLCKDLLLDLQLDLQGSLKQNNRLYYVHKLLNCILLHIF